MKATSRNILLGGTPSKTTLPRFATDLKRSATGNLVPVLRHHFTHRFNNDAREFVNHIVELLELDGGLVCEAPVPAKNQALP